MNYNKDKFLSILNKLKESFGSQNKMAEALGISSSYITKIYDENTKNPPAPEYLKKIADNSKGITTYEELMEVCGYIEKKDRANDLPSKINKLNEDKIKLEKEYNKLNLNNEESKIIKDYKKQFKKIVEYHCNSLDYNYNLKDLQITHEWLTNEEEKNFNNILYPKSKNVDSNKLINAYEILKKIDNIKDEIKATKDYIKNTNINITQNNYKRIPVLGSVPAGIPIELIEDIIDYEDISEEMLKGGKEYFALKVKGTSMWPKYLDGDTIIVLKQNDCESGQDAIVMVNGDDGTFKRVIKKDTGITLEPINQQEYNSVSYSNEDIEKLPIKILGVVKEIRRKI